MKGYSKFDQFLIFWVAVVRMVNCYDVFPAKYKIEFGKISGTISEKQTRHYKTAIS